MHTIKLDTEFVCRRFSILLFELYLLFVVRFTFFGLFRLIFALCEVVKSARPKTDLHNDAKTVDVQWKVKLISRLELQTRPLIPVNGFTKSRHKIHKNKYHPTVPYIRKMKT